MSPRDIEIRLLRPGDENVVRALATYGGPGDPEGLLADPRTRGIRGSAGGSIHPDVLWDFRYADS